ncbi:MAG: amidohydrolase [Gemmatimonadales bacterium]
MVARSLIATTLAATVVAAGCRTESRALARAGDGPADLILSGGAVYTMDAARSWARTVAVRKGRIVFVGTEGPPAELIGPTTEVVDLAGKMVLPGFQDAHVHPASSGAELAELQLDDGTTSEAVANTIRMYAAAHPELIWIRGAGWQPPIFPDANPTKELLDRVVPDRPALLYTADGHSAWANSRALSLAGVTRDTRDPPGGRIERNRAGEPTGTLRESAIDLVAAKLPERTAAEMSAGLARAQKLASAFGITTVFGANEGEEELEAYSAADRAGQLAVRVVVALSAGSDTTSRTLLPRLREWRTRFASAHVRPIAVKLYADGVMESRTAALLQPYLDRRGDAGTPNYSQPTLDSLVADLDRDGFQIHVHAIGDRAIRMTLDAFEGARMRNGVRDSRHSIAHLELIDSADIPRFRELGVIANFEALWANGDEDLTKLTEPALGPQRSRWLYPIASVARSGAVVTGGSDWSVSSLNPLDAIEMGITHQDPARPGMAPWHPQERVDLPTMIALYTINAAYAHRQERETGSVEVGKLADLIVLDRNVFEIPVAQIHRVHVLRTLLEGKTVYERAK